MATEIIDLTGSPSVSPQPPRSSQSPKILDFASGSVMSTWPNFNDNLCYTNLEQTILWPTSGYAYQPSHDAATIHPYMRGGQVPILLEPIPNSRAFLFPNGTRLKEPWTQRKHELFKMGQIKYGNGHCDNITKHFLWNKTPQQVQSCAASFSSHQPNTHLDNFKRRSLTHLASNIMVGNNNLMGASASYSMPIIANNEPEAQHALMLFPEKDAFFPSGQANKGDTTPTYGYGFQMLIDGASTSMTSNGNEEVDLELRLGY